MLLAAGPVLINPSWAQIALLAGLLAIGAAVSWRLRLGLERPLLLGIGRTALQLGLLGLLLKTIFDIQQGGYVLLLLAVMGAVATLTAWRMLKLRLPGMWLAGAVGIAVGAGGFLTLLTQGVLRVTPWFEPHYLVPLGGMLIGNGMHALVLGLDRLTGELRTRRGAIETALACGATPEQAAAPAIRAAVRAATLPLVLELSTVGLVQIPGTMSGQILGGVDPAIAVKYQMLVMYAWVGTGLTAVLLGTRLAVRRCFTPEWALCGELQRDEGGGVE